MATYTDRVEKSVTHYEPGPLPSDPDSLGWKELMQYPIGPERVISGILMVQMQTL